MEFAPIPQGECAPLTGWPQPDGVTIYADVATDIPTAPNFVQTWANADGYLVPTGSFKGVNISNDTRSFVPLRGPFPVRTGQYIALSGDGAHTGRLQTDIWPTDMTLQDMLMLNAYATNAGSGDTLALIFEWLSNANLFQVSGTSAANTAFTQTITAATWTARGTRIQNVGFEVTTAGGTVAADATATVVAGGVPIYTAVVGAGSPRGTVFGLTTDMGVGLNVAADIIVGVDALGAGVTSTVFASFKVSP